MDHESAVERLYDLHFGRLDESARSELDAHLKECPECRSFSNIYRVLRSVLEEDRKPVLDHPTADEIVLLAYEPENLADTDREAIEAHLEECDSCRAEVSNARAVEDSLSRETGRPQPTAWWMSKRPLALAAAVLIAVLAYPAFLGLYRLPAAKRSAAGLEQTIADLRATSTETEKELARLRGWSGATPMQFVTSARRGEEAATDVVLREDRPFIVLGVDVGIPRELPDSESLRLEILDADGTAVETVNLTFGEARQQIKATQVVTLLVASSSLSPGPGELRVTAPDRPDVEPFLEASLNVKRAD